MGDDMIDYRAIGRKISYYRKSKQYTQAVLAEMLDVSESYMSQIECGKSEISLKRLAQIADILSIDITALLSDTNPNTENYGSSELSELIKDWPCESKDVLIDCLKCINEKIVSKEKK